MRDKHLYCGKSIDNGAWVTGYGIIDSEELESTVIIHKQGINAMHHTEVDRKTVHEFTGTYDFYKNEIWEGDMFEDEYNDSGGYLLVEWNQHQARFQINSYGYSLSHYTYGSIIKESKILEYKVLNLSCLEEYDIKRLGNIYKGDSNGK